MTFDFLPEAREELIQAALYYESHESGLGVKFRDEIAHVITRITQDPLLWRERSGGYRRVNCPIFPYYVSYIVRAQRVVIVAVAHGHKTPFYWKSRLPSP